MATFLPSLPPHHQPGRQQIRFVRLKCSDFIPCVQSRLTQAGQYIPRRVAAGRGRLHSHTTTHSPSAQALKHQALAKATSQGTIRMFGR